MTNYTAADVKGPNPGKYLKGPDFYNCCNTGTQPILFHLEARYAPQNMQYMVCEAELDYNEAIRAGIRAKTQPHFLIVTVEKRKAWFYSNRRSAVTKFVTICNERLERNRKLQKEHQDLAARANRGDIGAALAAGDY